MLLTQMWFTFNSLSYFWFILTKIIVFSPQSAAILNFIATSWFQFNANAMAYFDCRLLLCYAKCCIALCGGGEFCQNPWWRRQVCRINFWTLPPSQSLVKATGFLKQFPDSVNVCRVTDLASVRILDEGGGLLGAFSGIARYVCVQY